MNVTSKSLVAGLIALTMGTATLVPIAQARNHGQVTVTITPRGEQANAIRAGLGLYSLISKSRNRAKVDQQGTGNGAAIAQNGRGNFAEVFQRGHGQSGTITQNGNDNALGLIQLGRRTTGSFTQNGNGKSGLVLQGGW